MHEIHFIQDLAVIMLVAGAVTVLFNMLKQPVVLGYLIAGIIIGPHTPPFPLITDQTTIKTLAELGVIFLMFSLGLEFSLRKLKRVGATAFIAASAEMVLMLWVGYQIGRWFDWSNMDSIFLGAMLAISSTTIIIKAFDELGLKREKFAQLTFGILIVEDILGIAMVALLSGIAITGKVAPGEIVSTLGKLSIFTVVALVVGILLVPRLLHFVAAFKRAEMLLITVLGLCFGFCLLTVKLGYSLALGAFVIGAVMAESREVHRIERIIEPIRDMFSAIFFVAVGLLLDPKVIVQYAWPIAVITIAVIAGKVLTCGLGAYLAGQDGRTSMKVGMSLAQIGEFSFIIASLGLSLNVTSGFLYPVAVAVSAITTLVTPYLIRGADPLSGWLSRAVPSPLARFFGLYTRWLQGIAFEGDRAIIASVVYRSLIQIAINICLIAACFLLAAYLADSGPSWLSWVDVDERLRKALWWGGACLFALPFLVAAYRKLKALSMLLADVSIPLDSAGELTQPVRTLLAETIPLIGIIAILILVSALSASILPPVGLLVWVVLALLLVASLLWRQFIIWHSRLQISLAQTMSEQGDHSKSGERDAALEAQAKR